VALNPRIKPILDFLPLAVFFGAYKVFGLFAATAALMCVTALVSLVIYILERRIAPVPLLTAAIVGIFGGLTLWLHDETFIKIKPTLINLIFAAILLGGVVRKKGLLKAALGTAFTLTDEGWLILSRSFGFFFLAMAALNEIIWRTVSTDIWVDFKVFGLIGLTLVFTAAQAPFIERNSVDTSDS